MDLILLIVISVLAIPVIAFLPVGFKAFAGLLYTAFLFIVSNLIALDGIEHGVYYYDAGSFPIIGTMELRADLLSSIFIVIINLITVVCAIYGVGFLKKYFHEPVKVSLHVIAFAMLHFSMIFLTLCHNFISFLIVWELMSFSSFLLILFDFSKSNTIKAALNYLVQMHIGVIFMMAAVFIVSNTTGDTSFTAMNDYFLNNSNLPVFILFFIGFGFKLGYIPLHTWAADAYNSTSPHGAAVMSGVMKKMAFYGLLRVLMAVHSDYLEIGIFIILMSLITALYAVISSILQKDIRSSLAFSSIENIGIIGIGIGMSMIGKYFNDYALAFLGLCGGFLHIFNHALFKPLLFLSAGAVEQQFGTGNLNKLGGIVKLMPITTILFLIGSMSVCGLPPFNGFVSEFLIYNGIVEGLNATFVTSEVFLLLSIIVLSLVGGLSIYNYTRLVGIGFLGVKRTPTLEPVSEVSSWLIIPQAMLVVIILSVDLFPKVYIQLINKFISSFLHQAPIFNEKSFIAAHNLGLVGLVFLGLITFIYLIRTYLVKRNGYEYNATWGCGYTGADSNIQYTATSYSDYMVTLASPIVDDSKHYTPIDALEVFPQNRPFVSKVKDIITRKVVSRTVFWILNRMKKLAIIQTGQIQFYIFYAVFFILIIFVLTLLNFI